MRQRRWRGCPSVFQTALLVAASARSLVAQSAAPVDSASTQRSPPSAVQPSEPAVFAPGDLGFRFHGYLRSGFGVDGDGKGQQPFIAPLAGSKYRLGSLGARPVRELGRKVVMT